MSELLNRPKPSTAEALARAAELIRSGAMRRDVRVHPENAFRDNLNLDPWRSWEVARAYYLGDQFETVARQRLEREGQLGISARADALTLELHAGRALEMRLSIGIGNFGYCACGVQLRAGGDGVIPALCPACATVQLAAPVVTTADPAHVKARTTG